MAVDGSTKTGRRVLVAVALATLVVGLVIVATVPRGDRETSVTEDVAADAAVQVRIVIEDIDATRGTMKVTVAAVPSGDEVPPEGYSVLTDLEGLDPLRLQADALNATEGEGEARFASGSVSGYPFDRYDGTISLLAVAGTPNTFADVEGAEIVPISVTVVDSSNGFDLAASVVGSGGTSEEPLSQIGYSIDRSRPVLVWASVMMAIYWLLTAAIVAVVLVTILGFREWETRHLAWLAAMLFAFVSFRNAAPGSPPIGVYFDFASFFWAEMIVALCLAALVVKYLIGRSSGLSVPDR